MNNLMRKILAGRSVYAFSSNLLTDEDLMLVLEEGKFLSKAESNQVWHFTAVQNRDVIREIHGLGKQYLAVGDPSVSAGTDLLLNMPMLLVISGCDVKYAGEAADTLFGSMMLAAEKHGINACWLGSVSEHILQESSSAVKMLLGIPDHYTPLGMGAFGYKASARQPRITKVDSIINIIR